MIVSRFWKALSKTPAPAFKTIRFFLLLMIPISLGVLLLDKSGILLWFIRFAAPLMGFLGLPGEAALVFLTSVFLNLYSAIAVIETLDLQVRDIIILAALCAIAHNLLIECAILKKAGSFFPRIVLIRVLSGIAAAWVLNRILPPVLVLEEAIIILPGAIGIDFRELPSILQEWFINSLFLAIRVSLIIFAVIFLQKLMEEFGVIKILGKAMTPLMRLFGLSANAGYIWIVANVIGLIYGSAALIEEIRSGQLSPQEADLLNHHVAISHSQLGENFLFMAVGVHFFWVALPRLFMALIVVWLTKGCRTLFTALSR